jgi:hypothetical protein
LLYRVYFPKSLHCYFLQICYQAGQNVESNILELRRWGVSAFMSIPCPAPLPSSLPRGVDDEEVRHKVSDATLGIASRSLTSSYDARMYMMRYGFIITNSEKKSWEWLE